MLIVVDEQVEVSNDGKSWMRINIYAEGVIYFKYVRAINDDESIAKFVSRKLGLIFVKQTSIKGEK